MKVQVRCFGLLRDHLPAAAAGGEAVVPLPADATAGVLVERLGIPRELVFSILVDGERAALDSRLAEGAEVTLMPPFSGG